MRNDQIIHVSVLSDGTLQMRRSTEASRGITDDFVVCRGPRELRNELEDYGHEPHDIARGRLGGSGRQLHRGAR